MKANTKHMVIGVVMISLGIVWSTYAQGSPNPDRLYWNGNTDALENPSYEELVEKVNAQERRLIRLELIISMFKDLGAELNDQLFETEIDAAVDEIIDAEPGKTNIVGTGILIGALILLVVGIAALTIRLSRR